jgi:hypothetical protein
VGWSWLEEEDIDDAEMERRRPLIENVAKQIASLRQSREQDGFLFQSQIEDGHYDGPDEFDSDEDAHRHELNRRLARAREEAEEDTLLQELANLGARMNRPYEHHNEDEAYMAYAERER